MNVYMDPGTRAMLEALAAPRGISPSAMIRMLIRRAYVDSRRSE
jgi:hypothetical protein